MKKLVCLVALASFMGVSAQSSDTLFAVDIYSTLLEEEELRTPVDDVNQSIGDVATYLQKDSRFQIRQYAPGSVATLNLGGTNSAQTRILWEGIDISSMASGVVDLSLVPSTLLSSNAISTGANAAFANENGVVGGINLNWTATKEPFFTTSIGASSIGLRSFVVENGGRFSGLQYRSLIKAEQSDNQYSYTLGNNDFIMKGMEYSSLTVLQRYEGSVGRVDWNTNVWYTEGAKSNRGSVLTSGSRNHLEDRAVRGLFSAKRKDWKAVLFYGKEWQSYTDTSSFLNITDTNTYDQISVKVSKSGKKSSTSIYGAYVSGRGTSRDAQLAQITGVHIQRFGKALSGQIKSTYWNGRFYGGAQVNWSGQGTLGKHQLSGGTFYRLPTINDLYWVPGGNPDLFAEQSYGLKYGFKWSQKQWSLFATSDQLLFSNLIQWVPGNGGVWRPENVENAYTSSTTLILRHQQAGLLNEVSLTHGYSRVLKAIVPANQGKQLLYRPNVTGIHTVGYSRNNIDLQWRTHFLGSRHTLRDNASQGRLAPELWCDFSLSTDVIKKLKVLATVHNITGASRNFFPNYPMPGRYFSITLQLKSKT